MQGYPYHLVHLDAATADGGFAAELLQLVRGSESSQRVGHAQYSPTRRTFCVEVMEQAAKMPESHADLLLSESMRATRYATAPHLYTSERKVGIVPRLETDVSSSFPTLCLSLLHGEALQWITWRVRSRAESRFCNPSHAETGPHRHIQHSKLVSIKHPSNAATAVDVAARRRCTMFEAPSLTTSRMLWRKAPGQSLQGRL